MAYLMAFISGTPANRPPRVENIVAKGGGLRNSMWRTKKGLRTSSTKDAFVQDTRTTQRTFSKRTLFRKGLQGMTVSREKLRYFLGLEAPPF